MAEIEGGGQTLSDARESAMARADSDDSGGAAVVEESAGESESPEVEAGEGSQEAGESTEDSSSPPRYEVVDGDGDGEESSPDARQFIFNGETVSLSQEQENQLLHQGMLRLQDMHEQRSAAAPQQAQQAATQQEVEQGQLVGMQHLAPELQAQVQQMQAELQDLRVQREVQRINDTLDSEFTKHEVFKDNPDLVGLSRKFAMTVMHDNPRLSESEAVKAVARDVSQGLNKFTDKWITDKVTDSQSAEGGRGGTVASTPSKSFKGKDLFNGKLLRSLIDRAGKDPSWH